MVWGGSAYLWLVLPALAVLALLLLASRGNRTQWREFGGTGRIIGGVQGRRHESARGVVMALAFLLIIAALCRPQWGSEKEEGETEGIDIIVALDTSSSMGANDLHPSRLLAAKEAVAALTARLRGDRVGLVAFAGSAFVVCPLTSDYALFHAALAEVGTRTIQRGGTSLAAALEEAGGAFSEGGAGKAVILISDGEDHGSDYAAAAARLRRCGVTVCTVAAGTHEGALIPLSEGGFHKDGAGLVVKSRLDQAPLREIASACQGRVVDLGAGRGVLVDLYESGLSTLQRRVVPTVRQRLRERFQIPLALALCLLAAEPCIGWRRKG